MALKRNITKAEYEAMSAEIKAEYVADGDSFKLDLAGETDDTGALKRAKDREAQLRRDAEERAKDAEDRLAELDQNDAKKRGDIETLEKSWQKRMDDQAAADKAKIDRYEANLRATLIDGVANKLASEISTSPSLLLPHIKARLQADLDGDAPATKVLDRDGKPSAMTVADLSKEFVDNKDFAAIIRATKASGGGATNDGQRMRLGGATQNDEGKAALLSDTDPKNLAAMLAERKANAS